MKLFKLAFLSLCGLIALNVKAQEANFSEVPGTVIAHKPKSGKVYLGSPSICKLPNGDYLVSHDNFGPSTKEHEMAISNIYRSTNKGKTWRLVTEINGAFWSKLFVHNKEVYFIGTNKHHGNLILRKSTDNGSTWTAPVDTNSGLLLQGEYHVASTPPIYSNGRIWRAIEDASGTDRKIWGPRYAAMMISAPEDADLLKAESWTKSNFIPMDSTYLNGKFGGWVEGNALVAPNGELVNVLRVHDKGSFDEKAAIVRISTDGKVATFDHAKDFILFPGGSKKFVIKYDKKSKKYWSLVNYVPEDVKLGAKKLPKVKFSTHIRNTLALCSSTDLMNWQVNKIVLQHPDILKHAFQYADWLVEGKDILFVSRTAFDDGLGGAANNHNNNFITFHKIKNFR
ncbi:sialidase family protein [Pedobacter sp. UBA4863]|uniref:sialidase family protein n=1 Tax=Pedobacter sp. UBA4863 TaxID=1947060 RepID=UPI0025CC0C35|nr:sialidase family protein [Pedobacter sp. UBA4863]